MRFPTYGGGEEMRRATPEGRARILPTRVVIVRVGWDSYGWGHDSYAMKGNARSPTHGGLDPARGIAGLALPRGLREATRSYG
jgi:hypothetical protein